MGRSYWAYAAVLGFGLVLPSAVALAQPAVAPTGVTVQSVRNTPHPSKDNSPAGKADFRDLPSVVAGTVHNGEPADPGEWPATMISRPSGCTATLVGPRIVLTAAHCVDHGGRVMFWIAGRTREASCFHHPDYSPDGKKWAQTSADYAVCAIDAGHKVQGVPFEIVGAGPLFGVGEKVKLLGFGCNGTTIDSDGYGTLRVAAAGIEQLPSPPVQYFVSDWSIGGFKHAKGGVVCPGDSGGAVYWPVQGLRRIVALNSRTGVEADERTLNGKSYLSSVLSQSGLTKSPYDFLKMWSTAEYGGICGIPMDSGATMVGCRQ